MQVLTTVVAVAFAMVLFGYFSLVVAGLLLHRTIKKLTDAVPLMTWLTLDHRDVVALGFPRIWTIMCLFVVHERGLVDVRVNREVPEDLAGELAERSILIFLTLFEFRIKADRVREPGDPATDLLTAAALCPV